MPRSFVRDVLKVTELLRIRLQHFEPLSFNIAIGDDDTLGDFIPDDSDVMSQIEVVASLENVFNQFIEASRAGKYGRQMTEEGIAEADYEDF